MKRFATGDIGTRTSPTAKRQRTNSLATASDAACAVSCAIVDLTGSPEEPPAKARAPRVASKTPECSSAMDATATDTANGRPLSTPTFHLTPLEGAPPQHNRYALGLSELVAGDFTHCMLANYKYDLPWLLGECPRLRVVPVVLVRGERDRPAMALECRGFTNLTMVAPRLPIPYGTHHTKMLVLVYPTKVRVAIFTANFIAIDWNNKTQGVWYQDFDLKPTMTRPTPSPSTAAPTPTDRESAVVDFERDLVDYLSCLGPAVEQFCVKLTPFDFSTATVALVPSVPGVHTGSNVHKYGHLRLRRLLKYFGATSSDHPLICQFSSMGSLDEKWLFGEFTASLMPGSTLSVLGANSLPIKAFHIIWPAVEDVRNSIEGWNAGRAVPCPLKNMKPFLHKYLRKWTPPEPLHRQNAMPHIKTYARFDPAQTGRVDWALLTSSNLSKAAWGAFQKNATQFMIRSYELGVLFVPSMLAGLPGSPLPTPSALAVVGSRAADHSIADQLVLPLPYGFPMKTYNPKTDEPWVWDLVREDPDVYGNCYIPH